MIRFDIVTDVSMCRRVADHAYDAPRHQMCEAFPEDGLAYVREVVDSFLQKFDTVSRADRRTVWKRLGQTDLDAYDRVYAILHANGNVSVYVLGPQA